MIRAGNAFAVGVLTVAGGALATRAAVVLTDDRPDVPATAGGYGDASVAGDVVVDVTGLSFPRSITVGTGGSVTWTNGDAAPHTVSFATALDGASAGDGPTLELAAGAQTSMRFDVAGTYPYSCEIHRSMAGEVAVVQASEVVDVDDDSDDWGY